MSDDATTRRAAIASQQAELVAAMVTGGAPPTGVDAHRVAVAAEALLRKRAGEVAWRWPGLLGSDDARARFVTWARGRPRSTSFGEGWEFAEHLEATGALDAAGTAELAAARRQWARRPDGTARRRRVWLSPRARGRGGR